MLARGTGKEIAPILKKLTGYGINMAKALEEWVDVGILTQKLEYKQYLYELLSGKVKQVFPKLLTEYEEAALKYYTTNAGYKHFNKALRGEIAMTEEFAAQERILNKALDKLPISTHNNADKLLYRIENLTDAQISEYYLVGKTITNKHFTSATYSDNAIGKTMKRRPYTVVIRIEGKSGRLIEDLSTFKREKEILFKSKTQFYVKEIKTTTSPEDWVSEIKTIILIEK